MEVINQFINASRIIIKTEKLKALYKVYIVFSVLMLLLLPFVGGFISIFGLIIVLLYCVAACIYNRNAIKNPSAFKKIFLSYFLMFGYLFIIFNLTLYSLPRLMKLNLDIFVLFIIGFEVICMAFGCLYTYFSIKKNKIKEYKGENVLVTSLIASLCSCLTIFLRRVVSTTSIEMQAFILLTINTICCCLVTFYIGKIFIPMGYFIKKYNIEEFRFTNE